jgi:hypothetical protein
VEEREKRTVKKKRLTKKKKLRNQKDKKRSAIPTISQRFYSHGVVAALQCFSLGALFNGFLTAASLFLSMLTRIVGVPYSAMKIMGERIVLCCTAGFYGPFLYSSDSCGMCIYVKGEGA